jgi:glycosyltransferase involved in cell wall biosynthesis
MSLKVLIIAHDHPELRPGGAEIAAHLLFRGLQQSEGVNPYFLARTAVPGQRRSGTPFSSFRGSPDQILMFTDDNDNFIFSQRSQAVIDGFRALILQIKPDVIHFHHYLYIGLELIAVARAVNPKVRIVVTLHEYYAICNSDGQMVKTGSTELCQTASPADCANCFKNIAPSEFLLRELFIKSHFEKVDTFIAPSEFLRQRYIAWGLPPWQIIVLENGILPVPPPPPRPLADGEGRAVFAFFGQITPYKGLIPLLAAFEHLDRLPPHSTAGIRLVVNGAHLDWNHPQYVETVKGLLARTAHRVHFAGAYRRDDLYRLMSAVDWVVVPSTWWENSPLVIQEALAHRRPVLCSNIGGMAEKVRWGQDGFHFTPASPLELAGLLVRLANSETVWDDLQHTMRLPTTIGEAVTRHLALYRDTAFALAH